MTNTSKPLEDSEYSLDELVGYLQGEKDLDGIWFGQNPTDRPRYWWRGKLVQAITKEIARAKIEEIEKLEAKFDSTNVRLPLTFRQIIKDTIRQLKQQIGEE